MALALFLGAAAIAVGMPLNGGTGISADDPPITVGAGWWATTTVPPAFFWGASGWNNEGPFTFSYPAPVVVYVTDDFEKGDRFEVYDFGGLVGTTSLVPTASGVEVGPTAAYADPTYSSGVFTLGAGSHSITLYAVNNPYVVGRGYIKVEPAGQVIPEPGTIALFGLGLVVVARARRRRKR